jgi:hypothetical protein
MRVGRNTVLFCAGLLTGFACLSVHADECIRSTPFPIFKGHDRVKEHRFELKANSEAFERFRLASGMQVLVTHGGCEYFVTKFRFESKDLFASGYSTATAYKAAASLLRELDRLRAHSTFDLHLASATLLRAARRNHHLKLNEEFAVSGDGVAELEARTQIDAAGRRPSEGYLELTLFRGPL